MHPEIKVNKLDKNHLENHGGNVEWDPEVLGQALLKDEANQWAAVSNLDEFFCKVYNYFNEEGLICIIVSRITNLITLAFTICFSTFLMLFVRWSKLLECSQRNTIVIGDDVSDSIPSSNPQAGGANPCHELLDYSLVDSLGGASCAEGAVLTYFFIFCLYWLVTLKLFVNAVRDGLEMRVFYNQKLDIRDEDLASLEWCTIIEKIVQLQDRLKLCVVKDLTVLDITNRIMRKDNYMIAIANNGLLDFELSFPFYRCCKRVLGCCFCSKLCCCCDTGQKKRPKVRGETWTLPTSHSLSVGGEIIDSTEGDGRGEENQRRSRRILGCLRLRPRPNEDGGRAHGGYLVFGKTLEWSLRKVLLNDMFDSNGGFKGSFSGAKGGKLLRRQLILTGIFNFAFLGFIMIFMIIFFFLKNAEELHSKKSFLGPRQWTPLAQWKIREFNELPHFFQRRLNARSPFSNSTNLLVARVLFKPMVGSPFLSDESSQKFTQQFPSTVSSIIAQCSAYISGAVVAVLFLLTFADSSMLLTVSLLGRPLLWHLAFFSALLALSRSSIVPSRRASAVECRPAHVMMEVVKHTHYLPAHWKGRLSTTQVRDEFGALYKQRLYVFLSELASAFLSPFILCFLLPKHAEAIVDFMATCTSKLDGMGDLCSQALFNLDEFGDEGLLQGLSRYQPGVSPVVDAADGGRRQGGQGPDRRKGAGAEGRGRRAVSDSDRKAGGGPRRRTAHGGAYSPPTGLEPLSPPSPMAQRASSAGSTGSSNGSPREGRGRRQYRMQGGKLEKSVLSFAMNHPSWQADASHGSRLLTSLASLQTPYRRRAERAEQERWQQASLLLLSQRQQNAAMLRRKGNQFSGNRGEMGQGQGRGGGRVGLRGGDEVDAGGDKPSSSVYRSQSFDQPLGLGGRRRGVELREARGTWEERAAAAAAAGGEAAADLSRSDVALVQSFSNFNTLLNGSDTPALGGFGGFGGLEGSEMHPSESVASYMRGTVGAGYGLDLWGDMEASALADNHKSLFTLLETVAPATSVSASQSGSPQSAQDTKESNFPPQQQQQEDSSQHAGELRIQIPSQAAPLSISQVRLHADAQDERSSEPLEPTGAGMELELATMSQLNLLMEAQAAANDADASEEEATRHQSSQAAGRPTTGLLD